MRKIMLYAALIATLVTLILPFSIISAYTEEDATVLLKQSNVPAQNITLMSPNGGERWVVGSTQTITWSSEGVAGQVNIFISRNGGSTWTSLMTNRTNNGSKSWVVTGPATAQARIKVVSVSNRGVYGFSEANFSIVQSITVNTPNGGENWAVGSSKMIAWATEGITGRVNILLSRNNGSTWTTLFSNTPNDGNQAWTVTGPASAQAKIKITSVSTSGVFDVSNAVFNIVQSITVISPNGGETMVAGSTWNISWTSTGITGKVNIFISRNNGLGWTPLVLNTLNDGAQNWVVTGPSTVQAKVKIASVSSSTVTDMSDASCTISSNILFEENFNDGAAQEFGNETWNWTVFNDKYTSAPNQVGYSTAGNTAWTNYTAEADFLNGKEGGLLVRCLDTNNYVAFIVRPGVSVSWQTRKNGVLSSETNTTAIVPVAGNKLHIMVDVKGNDFKAYVNGVLKISLTTAQFPAGKIGLKMGNQPIPNQYWDNVIVETNN
jgi:hypothetical protein